MSVKYRHSGMHRTLRLAVYGSAAIIAAPLIGHAEPTALPVEATKHMVKECRQQHDNLTRTVDELLLELEQAQRSLDAARTRAALELSQLRLASLKQDMALCTNLLNMIDRRSGETPGVDHEASQREERGEPAIK